MAFISIIIPVYNVDRYLKQCVDSILNQTYRDFEMILVDDGSSDNSSEICDTYKIIDSRVKVIHKENEGVSVARNIGLKSAIGEYIAFVDSDDYWNNNNDLRGIVTDLKSRPDFILYRSAKYYQNDGKLIMPKIAYDKEKVDEYNKIEIFKYISENGLFPAGTWDKIIKRDFLINNHIYFDNNLVSSEDIDWFFNILVNAKDIRISNTVMYIYRQQRLESVTNNIDEKNVRDLFFTIVKWTEKVSNNDNDEFKDVLFSFLAYEYSILIALLPNIKKDIKKELKIEVKKYSWLLKYNLNPKVKKVKIIYDVFGFYGIEIILSFMLYIRKKSFLSK